MAKRPNVRRSRRRPATLQCHWSHGQATVFTGFAWIADGVTESIVIISDDLQHTKLCVYSFVTYILKFLTNKYPAVKNVNILSDGASSQFKQRYLFSNLWIWQQMYSIDICWNFFATSHGKGIVDGFGGTVKCAVWRHVHNGCSHVTSAKTFCDIVAARNPNVHVKFIASTEIFANKEMLDNHWSDTKPVPKTHQIHFVRPCGDYHLFVANTSHQSEQLAKVVIKTRAPEDDELEQSATDLSVAEDIYENLENMLQIAVSDWVIVTYDGQQFPGEVSYVDDCAGEVKVNVMHPSGCNWKWPRKPDHILYKRENVVKKIEPPTVAGARGQFYF